VIVHRLFGLVHVIAYAIAAPFWGGFLFSLIELMVTERLSFPVAFIVALLGGVWGIVFFAFHGLVVGAVSLPFARHSELNIASNVITCFSLCLWVLWFVGDARDRWPNVLMAGLTFCYAICECENCLLPQSEVGGVAERRLLTTGAASRPVIEQPSAPSVKDEPRAEV
jgi:hypothetical protein